MYIYIYMFTAQIKGYTREALCKIRNRIGIQMQVTCECIELTMEGWSPFAAEYANGCYLELLAPLVQCKRFKSFPATTFGVDFLRVIALVIWLSGNPLRMTNGSLLLSIKVWASEFTIEYHWMNAKWKLLRHPSSRPVLNRKKLIELRASWNIKWEILEMQTNCMKAEDTDLPLKQACFEWKHTCCTASSQNQGSTLFAYKRCSKFMPSKPCAGTTTLPKAFILSL